MPSVWDSVNPAETIGYPLFLLLGVLAVVGGSYLLFSVFFANNDRSSIAITGTAAAGVLAIIGGVGTALAVVM